MELHNNQWLHCKPFGIGICFTLAFHCVSSNSIPFPLKGPVPNCSLKYPFSTCGVFLGHVQEERWSSPFFWKDSGTSHQHLSLPQPCLFQVHPSVHAHRPCGFIHPQSYMQCQILPPTSIPSQKPTFGEYLPSNTRHGPSF